MSDTKLVRVACPRKTTVDDGHTPIGCGMVCVITEAEFRPRALGISVPYCAKCGAALIEVDVPVQEGA